MNKAILSLLASSLFGGPGGSSAEGIADILFGGTPYGRPDRGRNRRGPQFMLGGGGMGSGIGEAGIEEFLAQMASGGGCGCGDPNCPNNRGGAQQPPFANQVGLVGKLTKQMEEAENDPIAQGTAKLNREAWLLVVKHAERLMNLKEVCLRYAVETTEKHGSAAESRLAQLWFDTHQETKVLLDEIEAEYAAEAKDLQAAAEAKETAEREEAERQEALQREHEAQEQRLREITDLESQAASAEREAGERANAAREEAEQRAADLRRRADALKAQAPAQLTDRTSEK